MTHMDFEVKGVSFNRLFVRFRVGDRFLDTLIEWDGLDDTLRHALRERGRYVLEFLNRPPPPTPAQLQAKVGMTGHFEIPDPPTP